MPTRCKIKIQDNEIMREKIDTIYATLDQIQAAQWALRIATRIAEFTDIDYKNNEVIKKGFQVNASRQEGKATTHEVRKSGFQIHKLARNAPTELQKNVLRTLGQAVSSGHMKEHAMVASDYAIKTIGLLTHDDMDAISEERQTQLNELSALNTINS